MATNRDILVNDLEVANATLSAEKSRLIALANEYNSLKAQLNAEKAYYLGLTPLNISKKKESESKQASLNNAIASKNIEINNQITVRDTAQSNVDKIQAKIDTFDQAVADGISTGLTTEQANQLANQQTDALIAESRTEELAKAENEKNKALIKNVIIAVVIIVVVVVVILIIRKMRKKKTASK